MPSAIAGTTCGPLSKTMLYSFATRGLPVGCNTYALKVLPGDGRPDTGAFWTNVWKFVSVPAGSPPGMTTKTVP